MLLADADPDVVGILAQSLPGDGGRRGQVSPSRSRLLPRAPGRCSPRLTKQSGPSSTTVWRTCGSCSPATAPATQPFPCRASHVPPTNRPAPGWSATRPRRRSWVSAGPPFGAGWPPTRNRTSPACWTFATTAVPTRCAMWTNAGWTRPLRPSGNSMNTVNGPTRDQLSAPARCRGHQQAGVMVAPANVDAREHLDAPPPRGERPGDPLPGSEAHTPPPLHGPAAIQSVWWWGPPISRATTSPWSQRRETLKGREATPQRPRAGAAAPALPRRAAPAARPAGKPPAPRSPCPPRPTRQRVSGCRPRP